MRILIRQRCWAAAAILLAAFLVPVGPVYGQENVPSSDSGTQPQPAPVAEPTAATTPSEPKPFDLWTAKRLTGDWAGVRTDLEDIGITLQLTYQQQFMVNTLGGLETKNGNDFAGSYDFDVELDFFKMLKIPGASFFLRTKGTWGGEGSDFDREKIGGLYRTNADAGAEEPIFVDRWWYKQRFLDGRIELRLGCIRTYKDLFDRSVVANSEDKQFWNQALIQNRGIPHMKGLGLYVNVWPTDWLYAKAAVVDADARSRRTGFDTAFHDRHDSGAHFGVLYEVGVTPKFGSPHGKLAGNYRIGSWYNPDVREVFTNTLGGAITPENESGDVGLYLGFDQVLFKENDDPKDKQGLTMFARYAAARGHINRVEHAWSTGAQYQGLIPTRDKDVLGFAVAQAILSKQYRHEAHHGADRETVYELYYAYHLTPWLVISPDFQVVTNPGGDKDDRDTFIAGLRLRLTL